VIASDFGEGTWLLCLPELLLRRDSDLPVFSHREPMVARTDLCYVALSVVHSFKRGSGLPSRPWFSLRTA
jgi:hypothetical protein